MKKAMLLAATVLLTVVLLSSAGWSRDLRLAERFDSDLVVGEKTSPVRIKLEGPEEKGLDLSSEWGGYGGPMLYYLTLDLSPLDPMTDDRGVDNFDEGMLLVGGFGGFIYKDFRFGGIGFGNSWETSDRDNLDNRYSADMSLGGGGIFIEYNNTMSSNMGLAAGTMLGAGSMTLEASGPDLGPDKEWDAEESFFMAYPYVGVWMAPVKWMWIELDAGYLFFEMDTGGSEFENDLGVEMVDGDFGGGFQAALKLNFGHNPNL